jgi:hypothetical protein
MASRSIIRWARRHVVVLSLVAFIGVSGVAVVLAVFQPQDLFINHTVNEALPLPGPAAVKATAPPAAVRAHGTFRSGEHHTSGAVQLVTVTGRGTYLRLTSFRTSNGPAVHVWLSVAGRGASNSEIARAAHVDLGGLKGNIGNQNYQVPAGTRLSSYPLVVIWCRRFDVAFGSAVLT